MHQVNKHHKINPGKHYLRDFDKRIIVDMNVADDSTFLSPFSEGLVPVISKDVAEYLENRVNILPPEERLTLRIHSNCIDSREQEIYKRAISEYYEQQYLASNMERKRNNIVALLLFLSGVLVLILKATVTYFAGSDIGAEVIDIAAWVLLWEALDICIFRNMERRIKCRRCQTLMNINVEFYAVEET